MQTGLELIKIHFVRYLKIEVVSIKNSKQSKLIMQR